MALLTIGGVVIPEITKYSLELNDIDSQGSTRSESGKMHREVIRKDVAKLSFSCRLTGSQLSTVIDAVTPNSFTAVIRAPVTGGHKTATMYAGNRKLDAFYTESGDELWDFSVNLIEY